VHFRPQAADQELIDVRIRRVVEELPRVELDQAAGLDVGVGGGGGGENDGD
jgi:hypothetical protein